jgi:hypothetical protein
MEIRNTSRADRAAVRAADPHPVAMMRLFDERDIEFLRMLPGYTAQMEAAFRRRRCRIFRGYLRSMRADLLVAQTELETLRIESPADYEQLALLVMRCRMRFAWAILPAYFSSFQYRWHLGYPGLQRVVRGLEDIRSEIRNGIQRIS